MFQVRNQKSNQGKLVNCSKLNSGKTNSVPKQFWGGCNY